MTDPTPSRVRLHDLTVLGRSRLARPGEAAPNHPSASRHRAGIDAASIAAGTLPRPRTPSSRPGTDEVV
jgi:hypothetical protein